MITIGVVHPGDMGSALAAALIRSGHEVLWASRGRSAATRGRAERAGLTDAATLAELAARSDVVISVCPPHGAIDVAGELGVFDGIYVDANAISPATATSVAALVRDAGARYVDGGIIGSPPRSDGDMRLYLSGADAPEIAGLFAGTVVDARVLSGEPTRASALKMAYAAWTKGSSALMLAVAEAAHELDVDDALMDEWKSSQPRLPGLLQNVRHSADNKGWRWAGEMEEIAATFEAAGVTGGFHRAAAEIYEEYRSERQ